MFLLTTTRIFISYVILYQYGTSRESPIAIFLADSDFRFFGSVTCRYRFLPIPIFFLRSIIDSIYKQKSMQIPLKKMIYIIK